MRDGSYVRAKDRDQRVSARKTDIWVGEHHDLDTDIVDYTLEVAPIYGTIASVKLSTAELMEVWELIGERLGMSAPTVTVVAPLAMTVNVERT